MKLIGVVVFQRSMVNWRREPGYMCILLYVKLIWCSGIQHISDGLKGVRSSDGYRSSENVRMST